MLGHFTKRRWLVVLALAAGLAVVAVVKVLRRLTKRRWLAVLLGFAAGLAVVELFRTYSNGMQGKSARPDLGPRDLEARSP